MDTYHRRVTISVILSVVTVFSLGMRLMHKRRGANVLNSLDLSMCSNVTVQEKSELSHFISKGLRLIPPGGEAPLCVMEVGTADGTGTTVSLYASLQNECRRGGGREFLLHPYEGVSDLAREAEKGWKESPNVKVVNEFVLDKDVIDQFIIKKIEGPDTPTFPGKQFYEQFYSNLKSNTHNAFFQTKPECKLDLVLIDSTRFAHAGIIQTILQSNLTTPTTVFIVEDDFWADNGSELQVVQQFWRLVEVERAHPEGEQWPWALFRIEQ